MISPNHESNRKRSPWSATFRALIAGVLVVGMTFLGPIAGQMQAADQPLVSLPIVQLPPAPLASADFSLPDAQSTPASRWSIASPDEEQSHFEVALLNPSTESAVPLSFSLRRNSSPAYDPSAFPAPPPSFGPPPRVGMLILGIVGVAVAVAGGLLLGLANSHCTNGSTGCSDVKDAGGAILGVGIGVGALGFIFAFHH